MSTIKVKIENYQAIKNAELEFGVGLTAIVGPTNSGKSSIIRAIKGAVNNQVGTGFINYDATETKVILEDLDNKVVWTKPLKSPATYELNGRQISKVGRTQNEEVAELLNMNEIEVSGTKIRLNFWDQMEKAFLMDKTPNQLFEFISQSKEQELMTTYRDQRQNELTSITEETKLIETQADVINTDINELQRQAQDLSVFNDFDLKTMETLLHLKNAIETELSAFNNASVEISSLLQNIKRTKAKVGKLTLLKDKWDITYNKWLTLKQELNNYQTLKHDVNQSLVDINNTKNKVKIIESSGVKINDIITKHSEMISFKDKIYIELRALNTVQDEVNSLKQNINKLKQAIATTDNKLSEFKVCPFCQSDLTQGHHHNV